MLLSNLPSPSPHKCQMIRANYAVGGVVTVCLSNLGLAKQSHSSRCLVKAAKAHIISVPLGLSTADVK